MNLSQPPPLPQAGLGAIARAREIYGLPVALATALVIAPWALIVLFGLLLRAPTTREMAIEWMSENRPVELVTFSSFVIGGVLGLFCAARVRSWGQPGWVAGFYAGLGLGLLGLGMEEVSWGQTFFGFRSPGVLENANVQGETNLHNLIGLDSLTQWVLLGLAIAALLGIRAYRHPRLRAISVPSILASCFLGSAAVTGLDLVTYAIPFQTGFDDLLAQLSEIAELLLGVGGFLVVWMNRRMLRRGVGAREGEGRPRRFPVPGA